MPVALAAKPPKHTKTPLNRYQPRENYIYSHSFELEEKRERRRMPEIHRKGKRRSQRELFIIKQMGSRGKIAFSIYLRFVLLGG